jgi:hypothetical protein
MKINVFRKMTLVRPTPNGPILKFLIVNRPLRSFFSNELRILDSRIICSRCIEVYTETHVRTYLLMFSPAWLFQYIRSMQKGGEAPSKGAKPSERGKVPNSRWTCTLGYLFFYSTSNRLAPLS